MPVYQVEKFCRDELLSSATVVDESPQKAAESIAGRPVSKRALQPYWYRVVDERESTVHEFSVSDGVQDFAK